MFQSQGQQLIAHGGREVKGVMRLGVVVGLQGVVAVLAMVLQQMTDGARIQVETVRDGGGVEGALLLQAQDALTQRLGQGSRHGWVLEEEQFPHNLSPWSCAAKRIVALRGKMDCRVTALPLARDGSHSSSAGSTPARTIS
jgi:hypothetical protein